MIAGSASRGSASRAATCSEVVAPSAAAASPTSTPARRNIPTANAVAVAAPPGTIRPTLFPVSCAHATANQSFSCSAIRLSPHSDTKLAASLNSASPVQYQSRWESDRQEEKTAIRLGSSRYSETPATSSSSPGRA
jgi:hypothetical protein